MKKQLMIILPALLIVACSLAHVSRRPQNQSGALQNPFNPDKPSKKTMPRPTLASTLVRHTDQKRLPALKKSKPKAPTYSHKKQDDLWEQVRDDFLFDDYGLQYKQVQANIHRLQSNNDYLKKVGRRAKPYLFYIVQAIEQRHMPGELALLPIIESAYNPYAQSKAGALGIWQMIPPTAKRFHIQQSWWYDGRRDILDSTEAALDYIEYLYNYFDHNWLLALAAYNSGEGTVQRAIKRNQRLGRPTDFWSLKLPKQTQRYVPRLLALSSIVKQQTRLHNGQAFRFTAIPNRPELTIVTLDSQVDLNLAASLSNMSLNQLYRYNPGFSHWTSSPKGPHRLLLPPSNAKTFKHNQAQLEKNRGLRWTHYVIQPGDTLSKIASKFKTTVSAIRKANRLKRHVIYANQTLAIPVAAQSKLQIKMTDNPWIKAKPVLYTVKSGDNLWQISQAYHVRLRDLTKWNRLNTSSLLRPGQNLSIYQ